MVVDKSLVGLGYEALMTNNKQLQTSCYVIFLTNAVCVLLQITHFKKTCEVFCLISVFVLTIRYFIIYKVSLMSFIPGTCLSTCFIRCQLIYSRRGSKLKILITIPHFQDAQFL